MRRHPCIWLFVFVAILSACSNTRFLTDDQLLYTGREKVEIVAHDPLTKTSSIEVHVNSFTGQKVNNAFLGRRVLPPIGLWVHNYWHPEEEKKVAGWLHKTLSAPPILIADVQPEQRAQKIENDLFDQGYFKSRAWATIDTSTQNPKKARVSYYVELSRPSFYRQIQLDTTEQSIDTLINRDRLEKHLKPGDQYNLEKLKSTRIELHQQIQNQGFFYFTPDFIRFNADTAAGDHQIDLEITRKSELPRAVLSPYEIGKIEVYVHRSSDTASIVADTVYHEGIRIISSAYFLRPGIINNAIFFETGELYSYLAHQSTNSRLNSLGVFRFVRISFEQDGSDSLSNKLDVKIDLDMAENITLDLETDMVMKSTGYLGPLLSAGITHGNTFKGAEKINVALKGGFEWQWGPKKEDQLGTFSYEFGVNSSLTYPKIIFPGDPDRFKSVMDQQTSMNLDFNILNRTAYYSMFSTGTNLTYKWKQNRKIQHSYSPLYLNSVSLLQTTADFDSIVEDNIYIQKSFEEQFIFGMRYDFTFDNTFDYRTHAFYFQTALHTSGNAIDLFTSMGKDESERPYTLINTIYSQFVKLTTDFRYYIQGSNKTLVFRLYAGLGMPYKNSSVLPYVEQFFSGGAYSVRGFTARTLGPGSFYEEESTYIDQSGDVKLEANLEYRFFISKMVNGAFFLETGNIWLVNEDENRPGSHFNFNTFYNELAIGTGFGLRFDFSFFVLRTDMGFPLRTPYVKDDTNWLIGNSSILKKGLFYVAIGYPF